MKKLILILFVAVTLSGCKKKEDEKFCWRCLYNATSINSGQSTSEVRDVCGKTNAEIRVYEEQNTGPAYGGGVNVVVVCELNNN